LEESPLFSAGAAVAEVRMLAKAIKRSFEETILACCWGLVRDMKSK
jgi:hypothetical protein